MTAREIKAALVGKGVTQATIARTATPGREYSRGYVSEVIARTRRSADIEAAIAAVIGKPVEEVFSNPPASALAS